VGLLRLLVILAAFLFLPAGTFDYWQAWVFLAVFFSAALAISVYLMTNNPTLLERRLNAGPGAEREKSQRIIQILVWILFAVATLLPPIDHRLAWSAVPPVVTIAGDILVALGFWIVFLVFRENTFSSATVEVQPGQTVVSSGPYAVVRHPMYAGALLLLLGVPLALGSWWGLFTIFPITLVLAWRLLAEEQFLSKNLPGYSEYRSQVRYRLVPWVW
jgi:protein-S-isoprenylcysteine O-methyltransferase Ste14